MRFIFPVLLLLTALSRATPGLADSPRIVASIKPLHSLVAALTQGLYTPYLLIDRQQSPHNFHLKPSDMRQLQQADVIVYAGPEIETFLQGTLDKMTHAHIIALSAVDGVKLLPARTADEHGDEYRHGDHDRDGHAWLSTHNAQRLADALTARLLQLDPEHEQRYRHNAQQLQQRLQQLESDIRTRLAPLRERPFIQFHDAFQYFETEFKLTGGHFFTTGSEHKIGARRLSEVRRQIQDDAIHCIFYEPPTMPPILNNLLEVGHTRAYPLDPVGYSLAPGADLYFDLMDNIARQLEVCLQQ